MIALIKPDNAIKTGHFARKQIFCRDWLIAWSHRSRFEIGLQLAQLCVGQRVLDYGCGDGTFLALLMARPCAPAFAVGAELEARVVSECRARLGQAGRLDFVPVDELRSPAHCGAYDAVFCMEVLEHVVEVEPALDVLARLLTPTGRLFISVPVETGLPLLVKQAARHIAGWRGIGDYPGIAPYTWREYWVSLFAGPKQHIARSTHFNAGGQPAHDHKGFNWMALRDLVAAHFEIERTISSPLSWAPPQLASQVWLLARKKAN